MSSDVVVIGAGIAGYATALALREAGATVTLVTKGLGGLTLSAGTIDVLGRLGGAAGLAGPGGGDTLEARLQRRPITEPLSALDDAALLPEGHPYHTIGRANVETAISAFCELAGPELLSDRGGEDSNLWLPTAVGAVRPSYTIQPSMQASVLRDGGKYLVVGLRRLKDLTPELVAGNLSRTPLPGGGSVSARAITVDVEARPGEWDTTGLNFARAFDHPETVDALAAALAGKIQDGETVLLPAVLGLDSHDVYARLAEKIGAPVGEIPLPPPSVAGIRLENRMARAAAQARVRLVMGARVTNVTTEGNRVVSVTSAATGRPLVHKAGAFVLATGGFESGALTVSSHGHVRETIFDLPLAGVSEDGDDNLRRLIHNDYWGKPQGLFRVGVVTDAQMRPLGADGTPIYSNLRAAGGILAGAVRWSECSGEGIALGSAHAAAQSLMSER